MSILKKLNNFSKASTELSEAWGSEHEFVEKYPFEKSFDELHWYIKDWVAECKKELERKMKGYCICKKEFEIGKEDYTEGYWYKFKYSEVNNGIVVYDTYDPDFNVIPSLNLETFERYFFEVPEELHNAYILLSAEGLGYEELTNIARDIYNKEN